ncbi:hypothetical protein [Nocardioides sp.]|uniref:hypothetical protein n=1 Tax=Nocardioides sp. TaxID=35761 RepID=UPI0037833216
MTWKSYHSRGEILRDVIAAVDERRDGRLPMDVTGVRETFGDELALLGALQLRWHTRLAGRIDRELMHQPMDLEDAVVAAWHATADELPGVLAVVDHYRAEPSDPAMAEAMAKSAAKERTMLAMMSGRVSAPDDVAARIGAAIESRARATYRPVLAPGQRRAPQPGLLDRLKAALAAA